MKRQTSQRRAIVHTLERAPGPLTPQEIHDRANRRQTGLGLATVYRTLNALEAEGEVVPVHLPGESTRYERAGRGHHHHFRCESCAQVFAFGRVAIRVPPTRQGGFQAEPHELTLYGRCPDRR